MPFSVASSRNRKATKRSLCPLINGKIIKIADTGDVVALTGAIAECLPDMNLVNLTTSLHRLAKLCSESATAKSFVCQEANQRLLNELLKSIASALARSETGLNDSRRQALSNIIWSLATLRCVQLQLVQITAALARDQLPYFKPFELASTVWAFAKLGALHPVIRDMTLDLQCAAVPHVVAVLDKLGLRFLSMVAWAFAATGLRDEALFGRFACKIMPLVRRAECAPELLVDLAWAFSSAGVRHEQLLAEIASRSRRQGGMFEPSQMAELRQIFSSERLDCSMPTSFATFAGMPYLVSPSGTPTAPLPQVEPSFGMTGGLDTTSCPQTSVLASPQQKGPGMEEDDCRCAEALRNKGSTMASVESCQSFYDAETASLSSEPVALSEDHSGSESAVQDDVSPCTQAARGANWERRFGGKGESPMVVRYSVKNTFLELEEAEAMDALCLTDVRRRSLTLC